MNATRPRYFDMDTPCPSCRESLVVRVAVYPSDADASDRRTLDRVYCITKSVQCECGRTFESGELEAYLNPDDVDAAYNEATIRATGEPGDQY